MGPGAPARRGLPGTGFGPFSGTAAAVAGLTLLALLLRAWGLGRQSIWVDEIFTIGYAGIFDGMNANRLLLNLQGPFHALVLFLWTRLFGAGEAGLRSLEALAGAATVPVLWWALRPLGRPGSALVACTLLAVSPFHLYYSQETRNYAFVILLGITSTGLFLRQPASPRGWARYTAVNVLGLLSNLSHAFLLVTHASVAVLRGRAGRPLWRGLAVSFAATALLLSPWVMQFWERRVVPSGAVGGAPVQDLAELRGATTAPLLGVPYAYFAFATGFSYGPSLRELHGLGRDGLGTILRRHLLAIGWAAVAFGGLAIAGAWRLWRGGPAARTWLALAVFPVLLTLAVSLQNLKMFNARYAAAAFPAFLLVVGEGITAPRRRAVRGLLLLAVLLPCAASVLAYHRDPRYARDDARGADAYLRREAKPGDLLFSVGTILPLEGYYWLRAGGPPAGVEVADAWKGYREHTPFAVQAASFEELARGRQAFILFLRPQDVDPDGRWAEYFARRGGVEVGAELAGVRILRVNGVTS